MAKEAEELSLAVIANVLRDAGEISNDELGEWWIALAGLQPTLCGASEEFRKAYEAELRSEHQRFKEEFRIEAISQTRVGVVHRLVHVDEE